MIKLVPATLEGHGVRLEPLSPGSMQKGLAAAAPTASSGSCSSPRCPSPRRRRKYIDAALKGQKRGDMLPWVVRDLKTNSIVGSTRYHDIIAAADRVEIGYTWYAQRCQRTHVNTTCKLLAVRVRFRKAAAAR